MAELKRKPNGIWIIETRLPDDTGALKRVRVSLDTRDKADAQAQLADWLAGRHPKHPAKGLVAIAPKRREVRSESPTVSPTGMTLVRWLDLCCTTLWRQRTGPNDPRGGLRSNANHRSAVKVMAGFLPADLLLADVTAGHVQKLRDDMLAKGYAASTVQMKLRCLSSALSHAVETYDQSTGKPYLAARPKFPKLQALPPRERLISVEEERCMLECLTYRQFHEPRRQWWELHTLLVVLMDTGFRLGEALSLSQASLVTRKWRNPTTGETGETVMVRVEAGEAKNGKAREVPATKRVIDATARLPAGPWFPWKRGNSTPWHLLQIILKDMRAKGFDTDGIVLHSFRHTCGNRLYEGGLDLKSIQEWMGHHDVSLTASIYLKSNPEKLNSGADILARMSGSQSRMPDVQAA